MLVAFTGTCRRRIFVHLSIRLCAAHQVKYWFGMSLLNTGCAYNDTFICLSQTHSELNVSNANCSLTNHAARTSYVMMDKFTTTRQWSSCEFIFYLYARYVVRSICKFAAKNPYAFESQ